MGKALSSYNSLALEPSEVLLFKMFLEFEGLYGNINLFMIEQKLFKDEEGQGEYKHSIMA